MKYTKVSSTAFGELQLNAGLLMTSFTPSNATVTDSYIFAATSGGVTFSSGPVYEDFGDGIDNVPANTKQLKRIKYHEARLSGTAKTIKPATVKALMGAADSSGSSLYTLTPRDELKTADFSDIWWVGDYSDKNGATNGGFVAIHLKDALNTGGFKIKSNDDGKGDFDFDFLAHYDIDHTDQVPFEVYVQAGASEPSGTGGTGN